MGFQDLCINLSVLDTSENIGTGSKSEILWDIIRNEFRFFCNKGGYMCGCAAGPRLKYGRLIGTVTILGRAKLSQSFYHLKNPFNTVCVLLFTGLKGF